MRSLALLPLMLLALASPALAQSALEDGLAGALRGCEAWILEPQSWTDGPAPFLAAIGLPGKVSSVRSVPDGARPPPGLRRGERFWRIRADGAAGYTLVVSDEVAMCHIAGWGEADMQPSAQAVLASSAFAARWQETDRERQGDMATTYFRSRTEPKLALVVSRADVANKRRDRIQVIATALYDTQP